MSKKVKMKSMLSVTQKFKVQSSLIFHMWQVKNGYDQKNSGKGCLTNSSLDKK
jgi:catabolite regulation protein CreA